MPSKQFHLFVMAVLLPAALTVDPAGGSPKPPNFILMLSDDLGYGDLGVTGSKQIPTPHIDSLAANGVRFSNAYVSSSVYDSDYQMLQPEQAADKRF